MPDFDNNYNRQDINSVLDQEIQKKPKILNLIVDEYDGEVLNETKSKK